MLRLFGAACYAARPGLGELLSVVHLVGVALAAWALCRVIGWFFVVEDLIARILAVGILLQLAAYGISTLPYASYQDHEIACVLPFGAVLAGRVVSDRLTRPRLLPALAAVACGYLVALGYGMALPQAAANDQALVPWLRAHHLTAGMSDYGNAAAIDLVSGGSMTMTVPFIRPGYASRGIPVEEKASDFDPRRHYANFVITTSQDWVKGYLNPKWISSAFGTPAHVYHYRAWTILIWNKNLLDEIR